MRTINNAGLQLIEGFEKLMLTVYRDAVGIPTVGWGHVVHPQDGLKVGQQITEQQATAFLQADLAAAESGVEESIQAALNDSQFAACVSLAFNIGVKAFAHSTIAHDLNDGLYGLACSHFLDWRFAGHRELEGLVRRRKAEQVLFESAPADPAAVEPEADSSTGEADASNSAPS